MREKWASLPYHFRDRTGIGAYERQQQERAVKNLQKKALALGFDLIAKPPSPECVS
jgi:hypothetical protein